MWRTWRRRFRASSNSRGRSASMSANRVGRVAVPGVPVMTIDGPSGSGKGTVSRAAARALGFGLLDSGALYRLVALAGRQAGVGLDDELGLAGLARAADIAFGSTPDGGFL